MNSIIVNKRVLSDDVLYLPDRGKIFKGNFVAILEYHTFLNEWSDQKHRRGFRTMANAVKFMHKRYPELITELLKGGGLFSNY